MGCSWVVQGTKRGAVLRGVRENQTTESVSWKAKVVAFSSVPPWSSCVLLCGMGCVRLSSGQSITSDWGAISSRSPKIWKAFSTS